MVNPVADILLKPTQFALDKGVAASLSAAGLCTRLDGKSLRIVASPALFSLRFTASDGRLLATQETEADQQESTDVELRGTPVSLARVAFDSPEQLIREGALQMDGDEEVASEFMALFEFIKPDLEEELAKVTGDVVAHEAGRVARGIGDWVNRAGRSLGRSTAEFLTEESRDLAAPTEVQEFCAEVDRLAADVDRAEAKLNLLKQQAHNE